VAAPLVTIVIRNIPGRFYGTLIERSMGCDVAKENKYPIFEAI
jgi:hypothetical protein